MDAHLWPSLYPAIIVGVFVSVSWGEMSALRVFAGAIGGLVGGALSYFALSYLGLGTGPTGSIGTMLTGALLAWGVVKTLDTVKKRARS